MNYVLVAGGRDYTDREEITKVLDQLLKRGGSMCIVEGGAKGVDTIAKEYAESKLLEHREFPPQWAKYGKAAGPKRNELMCEFVKEMGGEAVFFWDGKSKGTGGCISIALRLGIQITIYNYETKETIRRPGRQGVSLEG